MMSVSSRTVCLMSPCRCRLAILYTTLVLELLHTGERHSHTNERKMRRRSVRNRPQLCVRKSQAVAYNSGAVTVTTLHPHRPPPVRNKKTKHTLLSRPAAILICSPSGFDLSLHATAPLQQRVFFGWLLACGVVLVLCSLKLMLAGRNGEPWPHRAVLENVPDAAFHVTYLGQLLGLYLAHRVAGVSQNEHASERVKKVLLQCSWHKKMEQQKESSDYLVQDDAVEQLRDCLCVSLRSGLEQTVEYVTFTTG